MDRQRNGWFLTDSCHPRAAAFPCVDGREPAAARQSIDSCSRSWHPTWHGQTHPRARRAPVALFEAALQASLNRLPRVYGHGRAPEYPGDIEDVRAYLQLVTAFIRSEIQQDRGLCTRVTHDVAEDHTNSQLITSCLEQAAVTPQPPFEENYLFPHQPPQASFLRNWRQPRSIRHIPAK